MFYVRAILGRMNKLRTACSNIRVLGWYFQRKGKSKRVIFKMDTGGNYCFGGRNVFTWLSWIFKFPWSLEPEPLLSRCHLFDIFCCIILTALDILLWISNYFIKVAYSKAFVSETPSISSVFYGTQYMNVFLLHIYNWILCYLNVLWTVNTIWIVWWEWWIWS